MGSNFRARQTRPRTDCRVCGRSIAVTFNKHNGDAYVRSHVVSPGERCEGSGRTIRSRERHERVYWPESALNR